MKKIKIILELLNKSEKKKLYVLIFLMIIGACLETLGIGLVIPAISILLNGTEYLLNYPFISNNFSFLSNISEDKLSVIIFLILFFIFFIKSIFLLLLYHFQYSFSGSVLYRISDQIFKKIISQPFEKFFEKNSSKYLNTLSSEAKIFVDLCLEPLISIITEIIIFLFIIIFLIWFEPKGTIAVIFVLIFAMLIFYMFSRKKIKFWGQQRQKYDEKVMKNMQETFHSIKEIKLFNKFDYFSSIYNYNLNFSVSAKRKANFMVQLPRLWLELIAIFTLTLLVVVVINLNSQIQNILPILAVFVAAAYRIIPSANRIMISSQNLRYGFNSTFRLIEAMSLLNNSNYDFKTKIQTFKNLEFKGIFFNYKNPFKEIFKNLNFKINKGEIIGIVGSTGVGKSTLIDLVTGLVKQTKGNIYINDKIVDNSVTSWSNLIGYVPQNYYLLDSSIKQNIAFGESEENIDESKIFDVIKSAQLEEFINSLENGILTKVGERGLKLSGGQKQRLAIARALYLDPEILIFDEATSALDIITEKKFIQTIQKFIGLKTIIVISHRYSALIDCKKIYEVKNHTLNLLDTKNISFNLDK